jgi:hypothetical protein
MQPLQPHWAYYASLEDDLVQASRYVEICEENFSTRSIQFTRLLLATGSEVDVVAKGLCKQIDPVVKPENINTYCKIIAPHFPALIAMKIGIQWNPLRVTPWDSWGMSPPESPSWWRDYNAVKHDRHRNSDAGNLKNVINSIAGLYCLICHLDEQKGQSRHAGLFRVS